MTVWIVLTHHMGCSGFEVVEGVFASERAAGDRRDALWGEIVAGSANAENRFQVYVVEKVVEGGRAVTIIKVLGLRIAAGLCGWLASRFNRAAAILRARREDRR